MYYHIIIYISWSTAILMFCKFLCMHVYNTDIHINTNDCISITLAFCIYEPGIFLFQYHDLCNRRWCSKVNLFTLYKSKEVILFDYMYVRIIIIHTYYMYVCNNCNHIIVASVINVKSNKHNIPWSSLAAQWLSKFTFTTFLCYLMPAGGCGELTWIQQYYLLSFYQPYWSKQHAVYKQRWDQLKKLLVFRYVSFIWSTT